jgi:hypothetical protein
VVAIVQQGVENGFNRQQVDAGVAQGGEAGGMVFGAASTDGVREHGDGEAFRKIRF